MRDCFSSGELTAVEIRALAASMYEPRKRLWMNGCWECPQCRTPNRRHRRQCDWGITRDGLPEFREQPGGSISLV